MAVITRLVIISSVAVVVIAYGFSLSERSPASATTQGLSQTTKAPSRQTCSTDDLPYSKLIKEQIIELCEWGLSRREAIAGLQEVLRPGSNINPAAAARIVKIGKNLDAVNRDPLLLHRN